VLGVARRFCDERGLRFGSGSGAPSTRARRPARAGEWPAPPEPAEVSLVCRPTLDLHTGNAGLDGARLANLRADDPLRVPEWTLAAGPAPEESLYLPGTSQPPTGELAARHGDSRGDEVHFFHRSARYRRPGRATARS
jgi:hypothetical protein